MVIKPLHVAAPATAGASPARIAVAERSLATSRMFVLRAAARSRAPSRAGVYCRLRMTVKVVMAGFSICQARVRS